MNDLRSLANSDSGASSLTEAAPGLGPAGHAPRFARISVRGARAAYVGPGLSLAPHRNAVATVALALHAPFDLAVAGRSSRLGSYARRQAALIPPGTRHHLIAGGPMAFVYLDALSDDLGALALRGARALTVEEATALTSPAPVDPIGLLGRALLGEPNTSRTVDARIAVLVKEIDRRPEAIRSIVQAAALAGLSPSRCQHLLRSMLGVPFRRYRLWRRMALVMRWLADGASLTEAAHASGFSSSAHLSSAFKAMFGLPPSALQALGVVFDLD